MRRAIEIRGLGKRYRLGARARRHETLRERFLRALRSPAARLRSVLSGHSTIVSEEHIWALEDVNLDVAAGEVVGLVGRNGAGKTTLLKVLARITEPTTGRAVIRGRVASLLEVGTGFHPELTGRENVYLNGAILGMSREEIDRKFDEIVAFAEVDRFLDTQVKHYSSGMHLRLAFAVAAHLEPEILLVDEVLAVGDASFQRKCLGKMGDVARSGRTVLFVSHNLEAVQRLCQRAVWIEQGRIARDGPTAEVVSAYLHQWSTARRSLYRAPETGDDDRAHLESAELLDASGRRTGRLRLGEPFTLRMRWRHREPIRGASYFVRVFDARDRMIFSTNTHASDLVLDGAGVHDAECRVEANVLMPGDYAATIGCFVRPKTMVQQVEAALSFEVLPVPHEDDVQLDVGPALVAVPTRWSRVVGVLAEPVAR